MSIRDEARKRFWDDDGKGSRFLQDTQTNRPVENPRPSECIRCFSQDITATAGYDEWWCECNVCRFEWSEGWSRQGGKAPSKDVWKD